MTALLLAGLVWWRPWSGSQAPEQLSGGADPVDLTGPLPADPDDLFADVASRLGFARNPQLLADGRLSNIIEALGAGAAVLDADGDGRLDLYLVRGSALPGVSAGGMRDGSHHNCLLRQEQDGSFRDVTLAAGVGDGGYGVAAVAADYDNDGDQDLYVVNVGPNVLYRNEGDGTFEDVTQTAGVGHAGTGVAATFLDADLDGRLDLFVVNYLTFDPEYAYHYGPDAFPGPLAYAAETNVLYRNLGGGRFADVSRASGVVISGHRGMAVAAFDHDRDGDQDLYVTNDGTANLLLQNDGKGQFEDVALTAGVGFGVHGDATASMAAAVGDCNADGRPDLLVTDTSFGSLYLGGADGVFTDGVVRSGLAAGMAQYVSWGGALLDYDNDGDLDAFVANGDLHYLVGWEDLLMENDGRGRFSDASARGGRYFRERLRGRGVATLDFDADGRTDLLVTLLHDRPVLLRNQVANAGHWLDLQLVGRECNRDALGALVTLVADDLTLRSERLAGTGYLCQGDGRLHFGLGARTRVERIEIRWPGGSVQVLEDLDVDRRLTVVQGESQ